MKHHRGDAMARSGVDGDLRAPLVGARRRSGQRFQAADATTRNQWRPEVAIHPGYHRRLFAFIVSCLVACGTAACRQDMYNQPKYKPLAASEFFADGTSARPLPPHTVARGHLNEDTLFFTGQNDDGTLAAALPMPVTRELLQRGQERFNIYCSVCHGYEGDGNGMIVQRGFPPPNSYHIDRLRQAPPGYFYHVITNGYGVMYSYASRVEPADRWAIVAYIRALQLSRQGRLEDVPAAERAKLEEASTP